MKITITISSDYPDHPLGFTTGRSKTPTEFKTICKRGHPLSGGNIYITSQGNRSCKACLVLHREKYNNTHAICPRGHLLSGVAMVFRKGKMCCGKCVAYNDKYHAARKAARSALGEG